MKMRQTELIPTRASLLQRLRNWQDDCSWQEFFNIYWRLIYSVARKAGLAPDEAEDVVQETLISVAKHMPAFRYNPEIGSFKSWLLTMTRWRIIAQFRKRKHSPGQPEFVDDTSSALPGDDIPDLSIQSLDEVWEAEWQNNLLAAAIEKVKHSEPGKFQIFDFYVNKQWDPVKVASHFKVSVNQVYQTKHRLTDAIREEVKRLEKEMV
jgi:RNA polymerase sigma-70 factor (ECF subfamily)